MTNRERVIKAIRHENPDYTPHNIIFTGQMREKMIKHTENPHYVQTINNHIEMVKLRKPHVPLPGPAEGHRDEFGVAWNTSGPDKDIGVVTDYALKSADELANYTPPPLDESYYRSNCEKAAAAKGENFLFGSAGFLLFERAWSLCGMENLLCFMISAPDAVDALFTKLVARNLQKVKIALDYDIDGIIFGDDWGQQRGMIMGPPLWRKLIKPHIATMYRAAKSEGKFVAQHSCGDLREIFDDLIEIGLDVYQTFQPEIYDMETYKRKFYGKLTVWGGLSTQKDLPFKTPQEIYEITRNTMAIMGRDGGCIAA
ncbi:MAG: hypothetical protein FWE55_00520, partial [Synergistaceae bacterium]|nr:hypothetical protein [Synergistaceae bacterium]